ncbi:MAG: hypothetical protein DMG78_03850 [Acidobacteria bacterium]|nr:MAG: hypothetical protein DMG78_03850 [Acidobacteriota bacterium]
MARTIDQIRASKLPSNMMQFAARGALQVPPAENIEILVYLALHNKVFGELARMTLAGWDEKACLAAVSDPQTNREVLDYFISPDNVRPKLLLALLENPSVPEAQIVKLASSAMRDTVEIILKSKRALALPRLVNTLSSNPYLRKEEAAQLRNKPSDPVAQPSALAPAPAEVAPVAQPSPAASVAAAVSVPTSPFEGDHTAAADGHDEAVTVYMKDHAADIAAESDKPFQPIGGVVELLGQDYFPVVDSAEISAPPEPGSPASGTEAKPAAAKPAVKLPVEPKRENTLQKINRLDVKGRIQLALKGSKEERTILIRDGTKVVALAVLEAPKLSDGEVEKFASQKNVLQAVLRQIPLKRRFLKNYIVVRNLCANPRTPLDLGLGLMKNLLINDLKNISANKEVSETIRKLALKMYKQKLDEANKK